MNLNWTETEVDVEVDVVADVDVDQSICRRDALQSAHDDRPMRKCAWSELNEIDKCLDK